MCELLAVCVEQPVRLSLGWEEFALHGSHRGGNPDGWGVAYFAHRDVLLLREPGPAAESPMVQFLARNAPPSRQIVSHVRRATVGARSLENTQPFVRYLAGRAHVFAHNGHVADTEIPTDRPFLHPLGETDSERLFALLLADLEKLWRHRVPPLAERFSAVARFAGRLREHGALNFLYCDGQTLFAHGHRHTIPGEAISSDPGLYVLERNSVDGNGFDASCIGVACDGGKGPQAVVATTPLDDQPWTPLGEGEIACFEQGRRIR
jgi:predicted glutamine amidotransferase